jgi:hypothetical protein
MRTILHFEDGRNVVNGPIPRVGEIVFTDKGERKVSEVKYNYSDDNTVTHVWVTFALKPGGLRGRAFLRPDGGCDASTTTRESEAVMRNEQDWADAEDALREIWAHRDLIFGEWQNEETFVEEQMIFMQAAYEGGYADALEDIKESAKELDRKVTDSLGYLEG